jgi:hypothetical protein
MFEIPSYIFWILLLNAPSVQGILKSSSTKWFEFLLSFGILIFPSPGKLKSSTSLETMKMPVASSVHREVDFGIHSEEGQGWFRGYRLTPAL